MRKLKFHIEHEVCLEEVVISKIKENLVRDKAGSLENSKVSLTIPTLLPVQLRRD
jgi:hypothetical protein